MTMVSFQAEAIDEKQEVLVFVSNPKLANHVIKAFSSFDLLTQVVVCGVELDDFLDNISSDKRWYKIFWIDDGKSSEEVGFKKILSFFNQRQELGYFIIHSPFQHSNNRELNKIGRDLYQKVEMIIQLSPYTSIFLLNGVVSRLVFSLVRDELRNSIVNEAIFSLSVFSPFSFDEGLKSCVEASFLSRGGQRREVVGKDKVFLETVQQQFKKNTKVLNLAGPEDQVMFDFEWSKLSVDGGGESWKELFLEKNNVRNSFFPYTSKEVDGELLPKPSLLSRKRETSLNRGGSTMSSSHIELKSEKLLKVINQDKKTNLRVTSANVGEYRARSVAIPLIESPQIKRSQLVLKSLYPPIQDQHENAKRSAEIKKNPVSLSIPSSGKTSYKHSLNQNAQEDINHRLNNLFYSINPELAAPSSQESDRIIAKTSKQKKNRPILGRKITSVLFLLFFISMAMAVAFFSTYVYAKSQISSQIDLVLAELETKEGVVTSENGFNKWLRVIDFQQQIVGKMDPEYATTSTQLRLGKQLSFVIETREKYLGLVQLIQRQFFFGSSGEVIDNMGLLEPIAKQYYLSLAQLENEIDVADRVIDLSKEYDIEIIKGTLVEERRRSLVAQQLASVAPEILGQTEKKQYALVIQDDLEIRPSGGLIVGVGILSVESGRVTDLQFFSSDEVDGLVGGEVSSPADFMQAFGLENWGIADSGWNPESILFLKQVDLFLSKAANAKIDGFIAVNSSTIESLLGENGEVIEGVEYNEKNLIDRYLSSLSTKTESKNLLYVVAEKTFQSYRKPSSTQLDLFWEKIPHLLRGGEVVMGFRDPAVEEVVANLGWSSGVLSPSCPPIVNQESCGVFSVYQNESNVNFNKSNHFISSRVKEEILLKVDQTIHKRILSYESGSNSISYPNGNFRNYVRLYLPKDTKLVQISKNNQVIDDDEIIKTELLNKMIVGFFVDIPPGGKAEVVVEYIEPGVKIPGSYVFFNQKQPGMNRVPFFLDIKYDAPFTPSLIIPEADLSPTDIKFNFFGDIHSFAAVRFRDPLE